jgi:hypothetical protein
VLVAPLLVAPLLVAPLLVAPLLVLADPLPAGASPPVPVLVDPMAGPSDGESVGLVLLPPVTGELDAGVAGVEEPLPGVDEDAGAFGSLAVSDGSAALLVQDGAGVALADAWPPLLLAFAEAVEVGVLIVVALAAPVGGAVAVVLSPGLVLPPPGPPLVPLSVALPEGVLTELAGVSLGAAGLGAFVDWAGADDAEPDGHAIGGTLPWAAEVPPPAPPVAEPAGVPSPFVL